MRVESAGPPGEHAPEAYHRTYTMQEYARTCSHIIGGVRTGPSAVPIAPGRGDQRGLGDASALPPYRSGVRLYGAPMQII